jgi:hypothetical protein
MKLELRECSHELKEKGLKESVEVFETMHIMGKNNRVYIKIMA